MPEMEVKTPVYDVQVYLTEQKYPITLAYKKVLAEAKEIANNVQLNMSKVYWYPSKEGGESLNWLNKNYIVTCNITQCFEEIYETSGGHAYGYAYGYTRHEPVYLEDMETDCD